MDSLGSLEILLRNKKSAQALRAFWAPKGTYEAPSLFLVIPLSHLGKPTSTIEARLRPALPTKKDLPQY